MTARTRLETFDRQIQLMHGQLAELCEQASQTSIQQPSRLPLVFRNLGIASEKLQVVAEGLCQQNEKLLKENEELATARQAANAERRQYRELLEFASDGYLETTSEGVIQSANRAAAAILAIPQQSLVGKRLFSLVQETESWTFRSQVLHTDWTEPVRVWQIRLRAGNGRVFNASLTATAICNPLGQPGDLRWLVRDVTSWHDRQAPAIQEPEAEEQLAQTYHKGEAIPIKPQMVWQVKQGLVKLTTLASKGEEILVGFAGPGMPFGSDLTYLPIYQAIALSDSVQLVSMSQSEIDASPEASRRFASQMKQRLQQAEALLAISGQIRVSERLQHLLIWLKREVGVPVAEGTRLSVRLTHEDLASACCTTRVTITRVLAKLQKQGKVSLDAKRHIILKAGNF
ncbi:Crp/Fnr family transcriptional regulator [Leptolyngbya sp. FACHB-261]|uniref:Crp/Fnr family transcriptional regulator n=1 Tax=Leptolyngbya sp. FACHB-261 TaxID=2692806 RepID=UPI001681F87F|nr:Crp/Fnr family transcriptional regulator [Leptolyngbya sp. FACHB-261]MBD2100578.1 Crp/Fnr family transcriptional regulator [Leptolyngbya sp. FACHB-261]